MFNIDTKRVKLLIKSPSFIMLAISLAILVFQIAYIGKIRPFNSDDLYWQQTVRTWHPFSGETFYFGTKDIFVALGPFFALMEFLFEPGRKLLIAETILLTGLTFLLSYVSTLYFLRKLRVKATYLTLLPFVWLASFGYPLVQNYLNSDWRTFQIGFSLATFALVAAITLKDIDPLRDTRSKVLAGLAIMVSGLLIYGDPYHLFFAIAPVTLFACLLFFVKRIDRKQLTVILGGVVFSLAAAKIFEFLYTKAGVYVVSDTPSQFVVFDNILTNIIASLHGMLIVFGADFFGHSAAHPVTFGYAANAVILGVILYVALTSRETLTPDAIRKIPLSQLWVTFFAAVLGFIFVVYTSSTLATVTNYRFYILFIYCAVALLALYTATQKNKRLQLALGTLLIIGTCFNLGFTTFGRDAYNQGEVVGNTSNTLNYRLIDAVKAEGLSKGYGSYWHGNVNTYLSHNSVAFLPSLCMSDGITAQFRWLIDGGQFDRKADKSFYLIDPDRTQPATCTQEQLESQFGQPAKILQVDNKTILVFDYDITYKMRQRHY